MVFVRGIVFSRRLIDGCPALRDQLQLLLWGGVRLAVLDCDPHLHPDLDVGPNGGEAVAQDSAQGGAEQQQQQQQRGEGGGGEDYVLPTGIDVITLPRLPPPAPAADAATPGAEAAAGSAEGDGAGSCTAATTTAAAAVGDWAAGLGLQWPAEVVVVGGPPGLAGGEQLPGFTAVEGDVQAAPWQRLRLALAHANLSRAERQLVVPGTAAAAAAGNSDCGSAGGGPPTSPLLVVVGYVMKPSRERDLAREGLLNLVPQDGIVFAPLDLSLPLESQLPFHAVLHKASDELEYDSEAGAGGSGGVPRFGPRVRQLAAFAAAHPGVSLVDPLEAAAKVINREELARVCESLSQVDLQPNPDLGVAPGGDVSGATAGEEGSDGNADGEGDGGGGGTTDGPRRKLRRVAPPAPSPVVVVRAPRSTTVTSFSEEEVAAAVQRLGCPPPYIIKPVVACGTSESHRMALVLLPGGLAGLRLPLPAVVQEFVNHDATIYKVYVAGGKVFYTVRPSIPNVPRDPDQARRLAPGGALLFDSLKSLPTTLGAANAKDPAPPPPTAAPATATVRQPVAPSQAVLEHLAAHLREQLGLSLFGFDVVVAASAAVGDGARAAAAGAGSGRAEDGAAGENDGTRVEAGGASRGQEASEDAVEEAGASAGAGAGAGQMEVVVVDINYFPSYRGAEGAAALFRSAVLGAHLRQQQQRRQQ